MGGIKGKSGKYIRTKPAWNKGKIGFMKGRKFSTEHKNKIAKALMGNNNGYKEIKQTIEDKKAIARGIRIRHKIDIISHYSCGTMVCVCCGEDNIDFLSIDHINGGGNKHRRIVLGHEGSGSSFHLWLIRNGFPEGYQVLCLSCNASKGATNKCRLIHKKYE